MPFVQEIGKMLNLPQYKNEKVMIEGHTDASGSFDKNLINEKYLSDMYFKIERF